MVGGMRGPADGSAPLRVFIGLRNIAGYAGALAEGVSRLGHRPTVVEVYPEPYGFAGRRHPLTRAFARLARLREASAARAWRAVVEAMVRGLLALSFVWAAATHDVFVMSFGSSFCPLGSRVDWRILRRLGRRVVCMCHGSDVRPPYLDGFALAASPQALARASRRTARACAAMERSAHAVICNPAFSQFFSCDLVNVFRVGIPADDRERPCRVADGTRPVLLHCPSAPQGKGTVRIREMVERLRGRGVDFDYRELSGVPHAEVLAALARADVAVDQLWSDTPMPGFATEAALAGVPCVVGGEFAAEASRWMPERVAPTSVYVRPAEVEDVLFELLTSPRARTIAAERALRHAETFRLPEAVARRVLRVAMGDVPAEWLFSPAATGRPCGAGLAREALAARIRGLVETCGMDALGLAGKPARLAWMLRVAAQEGRFVKSGEDA
ncbi:hypothetical protein GGQ74_002891 [Desulfobaculum xiamenense]|uniref:Uncharacterized protein n=1 Tax=Desulfobaculum xiamenense TaxID=995050 RepID=A0A846QVQ3_9BACT|nr:glycosyltransferase [Desulfobaculum xiamenense]NJB69194.1 hypothetical protein [Desulfobaculum xiamenense]